MSFNKINWKVKYSLLFFIACNYVYSQVEHVPVSHPVYSYLLSAETKGLLPHYSFSSLPLPRNEIIDALKLIAEQRTQLSNMELSSLKLFEAEFHIIRSYTSSIIPSNTDSNQLLFQRIFSSDEKFIYRYCDSLHSVNVSPLGSLEAVQNFTENKNKNVTLGNLGIRIFGTLGNFLGYFLQATNGTVISGDRALAQTIPKLHQNIKFSVLASDFDFTESHIRLEYDWFYASYGRETRLLGSGLNERLFISSNSPPFDAISIGVKFKTFEYKYSHGSLIGIPLGLHRAGWETIIPEKYLAMHRFSIKPNWGEISFWENVIYSGRSIDLTYLNPLSFFKSLEHSLRDRDNSVMGGDWTIRPFNGIQLKGTFLLDDIIFSKIGTGFWSNKTAFNLAILGTLPFDILGGIEYSRVEPYTYSHFNYQNSMTNDSILFGSYLLPNSESWSMKLIWWWSNRYPLILDLTYRRHGENVYDSTGTLIKNVGADPLQTKRNYNPETGFPGDSETVSFLDGNLKKELIISLASGFEIVRNLNLQFYYDLRFLNSILEHNFRLSLQLDDF